MAQTTNIRLDFILLLFLFVTSSSLASKCIPGGNCKLPVCRCWDDPSPPGGLHPTDTPQMILISFSYAINSANLKVYSSFFDGLVNPNKCPARGTFFVQKLYSSASSIQFLSSLSHEIGVTSANGTLPKDWKLSFMETKRFLVNDAGISDSTIVGSRAPQLSMGGDDQMNGMLPNGLHYDSSCVTTGYTEPDSMLWPFTYDFVDSTPKCVIGNAPSSGHPGVWEFTLPELNVNGIPCATPEACSPFLKTANDTFTFLYRNFFNHYDNKKTPFLFEITPNWLSVLHQAQGTQSFLQYVSSGLHDTWIITHSQALEWVKNPVASVNTSSYGPWSC